jgi:hypothetical protein
MNESIYFTGLGLGQSHDFTALAILERQLEILVQFGPT